MQPTGRQQHVGRTGEAPHAHITTAPTRGLREVGHAKLRCHQCLPSVNRPSTKVRSGGRLLVPRWRLMVKSSLKLAPSSRVGYRCPSFGRDGISNSNAGFPATVFHSQARYPTGIFTRKAEPRNADRPLL